MRKYKIFNAIPIFDVILVVVIALAAFAGYKIFAADKTASPIKQAEQKTIRYTIEFENVSNEVVTTVESGQKVRDLITNVEMGSVVSFESYPYVQREMNMQTGELTQTVYQDRKSVKVIVEAIADVTERGTSINNVNFGLGRAYKFTLPGLSGDAIVRNIEEVEI